MPREVSYDSTEQRQAGRRKGIRTLHEIVPPGSYEDSRLTYMVVAARYRGQWVLVKLKGRDDWCFPGGHREAGETMDEAAGRELFEETGALAYEGLEEIAHYSVEYRGELSWGSIYKANIKEFGPLPAEFEIQERSFFNDFPLDNTRFPGIMAGMMAWLESN